MAILQQAAGIVAYNAVGGSGAITVSGTGTGLKMFLASTLNNPQADTALLLRLPGSGRFEGRPFKVIASGSLTTGTTSTCLPTLYGATSRPTAANQILSSGYTTLTAGTALSVVSASCPWVLQANLIGDSISGALSGTYSVTFGIAAGFVNSGVILTNPMSSVAFGAASGQSSSAANPSVIVTPVSGNEPPVFFAVGFTFGSSNAGNIAQLDNFFVAAD